MTQLTAADRVDRRRTFVARMLQGIGAALLLLASLGLLIAAYQATVVLAVARVESVLAVARGGAA